jgi:DNA-binding CsgD family transcriptional regulator
MRGRFVFLITILSIPLLDAFSSLVVSQLYAINRNLISIFYILFFLVIFMLPKLDAFFKKIFPEYEAEGNNGFVPYRFYILKEYEMQQQNNQKDLNLKTAELSMKAKLTQREMQVLGLLLEKQYSDIIIGLLGISKNTLKTHMKNIYGKLGVKSRNELYALAEISAVTGNLLTGRESQVLSSLLRGKSLNTIADELFISVKTVNVHIWNICNKYGVKSIQELRNLNIKR